VPPIWRDFEGHADWESPEQAVKAFIEKFHTECLKEEKDIEEVFRQDVLSHQVMHVLSMVMDDEISVEVSGNPNGAEFHV